jgi:hypothetical protein
MHDGDPPSRGDPANLRMMSGGDLKIIDRIVYMENDTVILAIVTLLLPVGKRKRLGAFVKTDGSGRMHQ